MRFVHLSPRSALDRVARHGIRQGRGRRGRGVYSVPLFGIPRKYRLDDNRPLEPLLLSDRPIPSTDLWEFLFRYQRGTRRRPIAVIFDPPSSAWPADLYVALKPHVGLAFLENVARHPDQITIAERELMLREVRAGCSPDIHVRAASAAAVGMALHYMVEAGAHAWSDWDDRFELVFRTSIAASSIERFVPLDRTHREAREAKRRFRYDEE